jgi:hypothetical protein
MRDLIDNVLTRMLAERLEYLLDIPHADLNVLLGTFPDLMLWVLFLGGGTAKMRSKIWFAKTAARVLRIQKVNEMDGIKVSATRFLWPEGRENYDPSREDGEEGGLGMGSMSESLISIDAIQDLEAEEEELRLQAMRISRSLSVASAVSSSRASFSTGSS